MERFKFTFEMIFSVGWLVPFGYAIWMLYSFLVYIVWPAAFLDVRNQTNFHPADYWPYVFGLSLAWMASVGVYWVRKINRLTAAN